MSNTPFFPAILPNAAVMWEHVFAIDEKRIHNGRNVGDDRYNLTVLFSREEGEDALEAAREALQSASKNEREIERIFEKRMQAVEDEALKELGFDFKMKTYSRDPIVVYEKYGGREIEADPVKAAAKPYPQFRLGIKQGQWVGLNLTFKGFEKGAGELELSRFCNVLVVDTRRQPVRLPGGGRPDPRTLAGSMIEPADTDVPAAVASLIESA